MENIENIENIKRIDKKKLRKMLYIYTAILLVLIFSSRTIYNLSLPSVSAAMPKSGRLTKELEARGVVSFAETFDIYAVSSGLIDEIYINKGDIIDENSVIATYKADIDAANRNADLQFNIERIKITLEGLALSKADIQDKVSLLTNMPKNGDLLTYQWAVTDAAAIVKTRQNEFLAAQKFIAMPFHEYNPVNASTDIEREWNKKINELNSAKTELIMAETGRNKSFNNYIHQLNIQEASINLERRKADLKGAEDKLAEAIGGQLSLFEFDDYSYKNAINRASTAYDRSLEDYNEALDEYNRAVQHHSSLLMPETNQETNKTNKNSLNSFDDYTYQLNIQETSIILERRRLELKNAENALVLARNSDLPPFDDYSYKNAINKARIAYDRSLEDYDAAFSRYNNAVDNYYHLLSVGADKAEMDAAQKDIDNAQSLVTSSRRLRDDASAGLNQASNDMRRAENIFYESSSDDREQNIIHAQEQVRQAQYAANDAERAYNNAVNDLNRASSAFEINSEDMKAAEITAAKKNVEEAQNRITFSRRNLDNSSVALGQAINDIIRAENAFDSENSNAWQENISYAETQAKQMQHLVDDAGRAYENAVNELNIAAAVFSENAEESKETAVNNAKKRIGVALTALDDVIWNAHKNLAETEAGLADARIVLERAQINFELAQTAAANQAIEAKKSFELDLQRLDLDITRTNIDLQAAEMQLDAALNSALSDIRSNFQGVIISVDKKKGQFAVQGEKIASVAVNNHLFATEIYCPESEGRFIEIGDEANIHRSGSNSVIKAVVCDIVPEGEILKISLAFETDVFNGGEYITVTFQKQTEVHLTLVPNEAIFREGANSFVWVVRSRQGVLGAEYYTAKVRVITADYDEYYTAISRGMEFAAPVVTTQSKELSVNGRVRRME